MNPQDQYKKEFNAAVDKAWSKYKRDVIVAQVIAGALVSALTVGMAVAAYKAITIEKPTTEAKDKNQMEGYYDPVNKIMCYWIKDSKATPACLYAEWPIEVEPTSGDEEYSKSKEAARNATYHY